MALFQGRTPEGRIEEAAYKEAWRVLEPKAGVVLGQPALDEAWTAALRAAQRENKGKVGLQDEALRHNANRGFRAAWTQWNNRVADARATKRRVIVESAHDAAVAMFATYGSEDEVRANTEQVCYAAAPQARWLNDGELAMTQEEFGKAAYEGVNIAADERVAALNAGPLQLESPRARSRREQRAYEIAADAARFAAVAALESHPEEDLAATGRNVAMDAAASAVEALPAEILEGMCDEDQIDAAVAGAGEALDEKGLDERFGEAGAAGPAGPATETVPSAAAKTPPGATTPTRPPYVPPSGGGIFSKMSSAVGGTVGPAAASTAATARVTRQRLSVARRVKRAVDQVLPEATGYGLSQPEKDRAYLVAREAAAGANAELGAPFTPFEAQRIAEMTTTTLITTWHAVGHLKRSGAGEILESAARDTAGRYLKATGMPQSVVDYLIEETVRMATPEWSKAGGGDRWADKAADARSRMRPTTFRGRQVPNYYELLQVSPNATTAVIEKAWRVLAAEAHPDRGGDPQKAQQINEARDILLNADNRRIYDRENGF